jgi:hypothetical protein
MRSQSESSSPASWRHWKAVSIFGADLGGEEKIGDLKLTLPLPFWRVSLAGLSSREQCELRVSRGDPWGAAG